MRRERLPPGITRRRATLLAQLVAAGSVSETVFEKGVRSSQAWPSSDQPFTATEARELRVMSVGGFVRTARVAPFRTRYTATHAGRLFVEHWRPAFPGWPEAKAT